MNVRDTDISGVFDLAGLNLLSNFNAIDCNITDVLNIPSTIIDIELSGMSLTQSAADGIAASLVANGLSDGRLDISTQQTGIIDTSSGPYTILVSRGWSID